MPASMNASGAQVRTILVAWVLCFLLPVAASGTERLTISTACCDHSFTVELALTGEQRAVGLMHRTHMDDDAGMLFRFDRVERAMMWMKNTLIPLDMIFIREDGTVADVHSDAVPLSETVIVSSEPVRYVLELNAGTAQRIGLREGDRVRHPVIDGE